MADNRLMSGLFGVVLSDNPAPVTVQYNLIQGRFQHGVLLTTGHTPARARLWNNTVQQTGRSTRSGNASAVFVASARSSSCATTSSPTRTPMRSARR